MSKRFQHEDAEILGIAYGYNSRFHRGEHWPSSEYLQIELMVDIRNLLYELNKNFTKIANPIMVSQDDAIAKAETTYKPTKKAT
jgi:predicted GNAT superfamily acetyltransferase